MYSQQKWVEEFKYMLRVIHILKKVEPLGTKTKFLEKYKDIKVYHGNIDLID
ncbi:22886_t:CDS:2 [Rhizophagus irregularis]|uniref:Uncharacterized protein n=1 Tax=Rhizophagus irregularis (strain DAOM 181602 / DAOM 197198 / MUCL 43194) TaxID=747089 RepID=U9UDB3_RHIID|nr:22886_t:CDS:2 [Rhizophagus irregularis]